MRIILPLLAVTVLIALQGCATVTKGTTDTIQVQVNNCSELMDCTATNKKGSWPFTAPVAVTFKKSDQDLIITCDDGGEVITRSLRPTRGGMIWGNVLIGGIIGGGLDAVTDAHWDMSDSLLIHRNNCGREDFVASSQEARVSQPENKSQRVQRCIDVCVANTDISPEGCFDICIEKM